MSIISMASKMAEADLSPLTDSKEIQMLWHDNLFLSGWSYSIPWVLPGRKDTSSFWAQLWNIEQYRARERESLGTGLGLKYKPRLVTDIQAIHAPALGWYSRKNWEGCAARFPKPLPYLWPDLLHSCQEPILIYPWVNRCAYLSISRTVFTPS